MTLQRSIMNRLNATIDCVQNSTRPFLFARVKWKRSWAEYRGYSTTYPDNRRRGQSSNRIIISILCQNCRAQEMLHNMWRAGQGAGDQVDQGAGEQWESRRNLSHCARQPCRKCSSMGWMCRSRRIRSVFKWWWLHRGTRPSPFIRGRMQS